MEQTIYNIATYQQQHPLGYLSIIALFVFGCMGLMAARRDRENEKVRYNEFLKKYDK